MTSRRVEIMPPRLARFDVRVPGYASNIWA
jgi:hypothetical protein